MRLSDLAIGMTAVVNNSLVTTVWPLPQTMQRQFTVMMTQEHMKQLNLTNRYMCSIEPLSQPHCIASHVVLDVASSR